MICNLPSYVPFKASHVTLREDFWSKILQSLCSHQSSFFSPTSMAPVANPGPGMTHCGTNIWGSFPRLAGAPRSHLGRGVVSDLWHLARQQHAEWARPWQQPGSAGAATVWQPGLLLAAVTTSDGHC